MRRIDDLFTQHIVRSLFERFDFLFTCSLRKNKTDEEIETKCVSLIPIPTWLSVFGTRFVAVVLIVTVQRYANRAQMGFMVDAIHAAYIHCARLSHSFFIVS